jgi:hypothetical protein
VHYGSQFQNGDSRYIVPRSMVSASRIPSSLGPGIVFRCSQALTTGIGNF